MINTKYNHPNNLIDIKPRYWVLDKSLKLESELSNLIKLIMRITKSSTKTLDNKGSSLQYKSKVDLLYDLDDIDSKQYTQLVKFGEIRNQFVHNHSVESYSDLPKKPNNLQKYLNDKFPCKTDQVEELRLRCSFDNLQAHCIVNVQILIERYEEGKYSDIDKYISNQLLQNIEDLLERTKAEFTLMRKTNDFGLLVDNPELKSDVDVFAELLKINITSEGYIIRHKIEKEGKLNEVYSRKE